MTTLEFLAQLNDAEKGWGLWLDPKDVEKHHIGQYAFENDLLPKRFIHIASLDKLAHQRQKYILEHISSNSNNERLGREWANDFLSHVQSC